MSDWSGEERRSQESLAARQVVRAREEAERFQQALEGMPKVRFARRRDLSRRLQDARKREREAVSLLGGATG